MSRRQELIKNIKYYKNCVEVYKETLADVEKELAELPREQVEINDLMNVDFVDEIGNVYVVSGFHKISNPIWGDSVINITLRAK
jgi:hypothetical protein